MSGRSSPENRDTKSRQTETSLFRQISENQEAIQGLSEALMPLLVANLQHLAEANRQSSGSSDTSRPPREVREEEDAHTRNSTASTSTSSGQAAHHVAGGTPHTHSGESVMRSYIYRDDPGFNSACDTDPHYLGNPSMGNAARDQQGKAANTLVDNAVHACHGNAASSLADNAAHPHLGNAANSLVDNAVHPHLGNAATRISGNAAHYQQDPFMYYGNAAYPLMGTTIPTLFAYPGMRHVASDSSVPTQCDNVGSAIRDRDQSRIMPHPHFSFRGQHTVIGFFQPTSAPYGPGVRNEPPRDKAHDSSSEAVSQDSQPGPSNAFPPGEDVITPFVPDSERGDLFSSDAPSENEEDASPPSV